MKPMADSSLLAIDVALLPPEEVNVQARKLNAELYRSSNQGFQFDESHLPHITIVQQFIDAERLSEVEKLVEGISHHTNALTLTISGIEGVPIREKLFNNIYIVDRAPTVDLLHEELSEALKPFDHPDGDGEAYVRDPGETIAEKSIEWLHVFYVQHAGAHFVPHITLGRGPTLSLDVPIHFTATRLALCHHGNYNTVRTVFREWTLGS